MTPERWQRVKELFHGASGLSEPQRHAYLLAQARGDEALVGEVEGLLARRVPEEGAEDTPATRTVKSGASVPPY